MDEVALLLGTVSSDMAAPSVTSTERLTCRETLRQHQSKRLADLLRAVVPANRFWNEKWRALGAELAQIELSVPNDLAKLPLLTKAELVADHAAHAPYGSNLTFEVSTYSRFCQTSGTTGEPLRWLDTPESWQWMLGCWEQLFELAGVRTDDRFCFPFSFGPFLGFWTAFDGAARLGRLCLPGGGMSSESRLKLIVENRATVVCCTPTYALRLAEVASELGIDLKSSSVRLLIVAGEPGGSVSSIRTRIETAWGARVIDHWGMTEVGPLAGECVENPGGLHILETECIAEIIDPTTGHSFDLDAALAPGPQTGTKPVRGELVITNLGRVGSPMFRYRTGDLVELDPVPCPCGRSLLRLKGGIQSRVDDMVTIRGNNVYPTAIEAILREFPEIVEYRISIDTGRAMQELKISLETTFGTPQSDEEFLRVNDLLTRIAATIHDRLHFRPELILVEAGSLPRHEMKGRRVQRIPFGASPS